MLGVTRLTNHAPHCLRSDVDWGPIASPALESFRSPLTHQMDLRDPVYATRCPRVFGAYTKREAMSSREANRGIKVEVVEDRMGNVIVTPVSKKVRRKIEKHLELFGERGAEVFMQEGDPAEQFKAELTAAQRREIEQGWTVTMIVDPWVYGHWRGWDVHEVELNPLELEDDVVVLRGDGDVDRLANQLKRL